MSVTTHSRPAGGCCGTAACTCAACVGLTAPVRPRFFAGQVLTETDLMALERYTVDTHRMHNRYLHGTGVVCGLELACEDCGDGVVLHPGYALDPCGRDLVVPEIQRVDVARLIRECVAAERRPDCEPPMAGPPEGCEDDQRWCLTLRHREWQTRPVTPLAGDRRKAASCSCGGNGNGNGNGNGHGGCGCGCTEHVTAPELPPGCEPTRTVECFDVGIHRCEDKCCTLPAALADTFPLRALECLKVIAPIFVGRVSGRSQLALLGAVLGQTTDRDAARSGLCEFYNAVLDLYTRDPLRTLCQLPEELQRIDCSERSEDETRSSYDDRIVEGTQSLLLLVVAYLRDCLCHAFNPPCPEPCDDRIVLGCLTMRDGKVLQICNLQCRQYAGSFVSRRYWLPIVPALTWVLGILCCFPLVGRTKAGRQKIDAAMRRADPTGNVRRMVVQDDFAIAGTYRARAARAMRSLRPSRLRERFTPSDDAVNLARYEGATEAAATKALKKSDVQVETVKVAAPEDVPVAELTKLPVAEPGERVVQYVHKGRVVGYKRARREGG